MADIDFFKKELQSLIQKFEQDKNHYLSKRYPEAQVRVDFLNPLFNALGWDIENKAHKPHGGCQKLLCYQKFEIILTPRFVSATALSASTTAWRGLALKQGKNQGLAGRNV